MQDLEEALALLRGLLDEFSRFSQGVDANPPDDHGRVRAVLDNLARGLIMLHGLLGLSQCERHFLETLVGCRASPIEMTDTLQVFADWLEENCSGGGARYRALVPEHGGVVVFKLNWSHRDQKAREMVEQGALRLRNHLLRQGRDVFFLALPDSITVETLSRSALLDRYGLVRKDQAERALRELRQECARTAHLHLQTAGGITQPAIRDLVDHLQGVELPPLDRP